MNLPKAKINRDTSLKLWHDTHSDYAKEQVVLGNQGLVCMVLKSLHQNPNDEDLCSIWMIGLLKAVNSFDLTKGFEFSTYATRAIRNEILLSFRKKMIPVAFSLDEPYVLDNGNSVLYADVIPDDVNFEKDVLLRLSYKSGFDALSARERKVIELRFHEKTQKEIGDMLGLSQSYISRVIKKVKNEICA